MNKALQKDLCLEEIENNRLNLLNMSNKTITIQQGTGDDALEMTVQVTQEELDKMEEIRSKDPSAWEGRGLDLVKAAKDAIIEASKDNAHPKRCTNWKLILGITLGVLAIIGTIIFAEKSRNKEQKVSQTQETKNVGPIEQWIRSECVEVNRRWLYEALKENYKSAVPESFNVFKKAMDNQSYRDWAYEEALQQKLKIGTKEDFELAMTQPNSDIFRCIFEIACYYGMPDSEEDMVSYLKESEENRKKFYYKLLEVGMPEGFDEFSTLLNFSQNNRQQVSEDNMRKVYNRLSELGSKGSYEQFVEFFEESEDNKMRVYEKLKDNGYNGTYEDFIDYVGYASESSSIKPQEYYENIGKLYIDVKERDILLLEEWQFRELLASSKENRHSVFLKLKEHGMKVSEEEFLQYIGYEEDLFNQNDWGKTQKDQWEIFSSKQYEFTYQYDDKEFQIVARINNNSHCVMKLQSPVDEVKSTLVSVWENSEFSSSYDKDFISYCQSVDEGMGKVISSAVKTKVDGVNALKSELIISPMGKSYYAAIYRIIHKKRMYMLNIYIPVEEYNKDKLYSDKCANNFKFN